MTQAHAAASHATPLDEATDERAKNPRGGMSPDPPGTPADSLSRQPAPSTKPQDKGTAIRGGIDAAHERLKGLPR